MNSSVPYIIGSGSPVNENAKVKKYRRRRVYVLNIRRIVLFFVAVMLLLSAAVGVFVYKSYLKYLIPAKTYYYLQLAITDNGTVASNKAADFVEKGGAGYIINDGGFRVTVSVYTQKSDADTVLSRYSQTYPDAAIYELKIPSLNLRKYMESNLAKKIRPVYLSCERELIDTLLQLDFSLGRGELSEAAALKAINEVKEGIKEKRITLVELKEEYPTSQCLDIMIDFTDNLTGILDNLFPLNNFTVNHKIKLALCMFCSLYRETVSFFQKL